VAVLDAWIRPYEAHSRIDGAGSSTAFPVINILPVDSLNVENIVEGSRCATALASHAGIPEPLVLRFEEGGGPLPPDGSLWREEYQVGSGSLSEIDASRSSLDAPTFARSLASSRPMELRVCPRCPVETILSSPGFSAALVGTRQRSSRYLSWRVVARGWIFALAFGCVSTYTYTFALVEGENIGERL
jgi:hypothetical protein